MAITGVLGRYEWKPIILRGEGKAAPSRREQDAPFPILAGIPERKSFAKFEASI
jgi:hypothetical protein